MMQSVRADIKEYDRLYDADTDFMASDLQAIVDAGNNDAFTIILNALKVGYVRGIHRQQAADLAKRIERQGEQ